MMHCEDSYLSLPALKMDIEGHEPKNAGRQPLEAGNGNNDDDDDSNNDEEKKEK